MKTLKITIVLTIALGLGLMLQSPSFAAVSSGAITVEATIPLLTQALNVTMVAIDPVTNTGWTTPVTTMQGFGGITPNFTDNILNAGRYYVVDVGAVDNSGTEWYITHTKSSIKRGVTTDNLDNNVNVSFMKTTKNPATGLTTDTLLFKKAFVDSAVTSSTALSKTVLSGGWLRIYYGIATGVAADAPNTLPVPLDKRNGTYSGSVTITLSP